MSATIIPLPTPQRTDFDPEVVNILAAAFEDAWETIVSAGNTFSMPRYAGAAREIVARRIIELAQLGEINRYNLRDAAVAYLVLSYKDEAKDRSGPNDWDAHCGNNSVSYVGSSDGDAFSPPALASRLEAPA